MLNGNFKKESIRKFEKAVDKHNKEIERMVMHSEGLLEERLSLKDQLENTWQLLNNIRNKPERLDLEVEEIKLEFTKFEHFVREIQSEVDKNFKSTVGGAGAGLAAGAGVAAFGPTAAMAIATTFGTASTGTAIAGLSGAAATNAALAWLGGGAMVAGGGGMAAGNALLALAGPVGWAIGGGSLVVAGLFKSGKNKKIGEEALAKAGEVNYATKIMSGTIREIDETNKLANLTKKKLYEATFKLDLELKVFNYDFNQIEQNSDLVYSLGSLVNNAHSAGELLNRPIGAKA